MLIADSVSYKWFLTKLLCKRKKSEHKKNNSDAIATKMETGTFCPKKKSVNMLSWDNKVDNGKTCTNLSNLS